ncbi:hypothetical protein MMPV_008150 [Pyropia vietnamensis]
MAGGSGGRLLATVLTCAAVVVALRLGSAGGGWTGGPPPPPTPSAPAAFDGDWATATGLEAATARIGQGLIASGESVWFHPNSCVPYTADARGRLWQLPSPPLVGAPAAADVEPPPLLVAHVGGTPLGGAFSRDGRSLYIADAGRGLLRVAVNPTTGVPVGGAAPVVELLAAAAPLPARSQGEGPDGKRDASPANATAIAAAATAAAAAVPIAFADDVDVCPVSGTVYFSDASRVAPPRVVAGGGGATLEASILDAMSGVPSGRLLAYHPDSGAVSVVTDQSFHFANGVAVAPDGRSVVVAETFGSRLLRVSVSGADAGSFSRLGPPLPGFPDGVSRDDSPRGGYWVAFYVPTPPFLRLLWAGPAWVRAAALHVPPSLRPYRMPYSVIAHVTEAGEVDEMLADPGRTLGGLVSSVARCMRPEEKGGPTPLYLGILHGRFVGRVDEGAGGGGATRRASGE